MGGGGRAGADAGRGLLQSKRNFPDVRIFSIAESESQIPECLLDFRWFVTDIVSLRIVPDDKNRYMNAVQRAWPYIRKILAGFRERKASVTLAVWLLLSAAPS